MLCHPERSEAQSRDPAEKPTAMPREPSTSLGMTGKKYHDFWRTRMALGIVAHSALNCALCARGTSRTEAAAAVCFRATVASARWNRQSAAADHKICFAIAWACAGDRQSGAIALGLHFRGRKAQRTGFTGRRGHVAQHVV